MNYNFFSAFWEGKGAWSPMAVTQAIFNALTVQAVNRFVFSSVGVTVVDLAVPRD